MIKKLLLAFGCLLFLFNILAAQNTLQKTYDHESIFLKSAFGGLRYVKDGTEHPFGLFGANLKQELEVSPNAVLQFKKYRKNTLLGTGLSLAASALIAGALTANDNQEIWLLSGFGLGIGSGFLFRDAGNNLNKAVWFYNRDLLK